LQASAVLRCGATGGTNRRPVCHVPVQGARLGDELGRLAASIEDELVGLLAKGRTKNA